LTGSETVKIGRLVLFTIFILTLASQRTEAKISPDWDKLDWGPHNVGLVINTYCDSSRAPLEDSVSASDRKYCGEARPIRIYLWYPASADTGTTPSSMMRLNDYIELAGQDFATESGQNEYVKEPFAVAMMRAGMRSLAELETRAIANARPSDGSYPVIVVGQGLFYEHPISNAILCEYLASHGFVVATCPLSGTRSLRVNLDLEDLETQTRDMEFVMRKACDFKSAARKRIGVVGFDLGGMAGLLLAMADKDVSAFVSLDSGIMYEHNVQLLRRSSLYGPSRLRVSVLAFTLPKRENEKRGVVEDDSFMRSAIDSDFYLVRLAGMRHVDFTSYSLMGAANVIPDYEGPARSDLAGAYAGLCRRMVRFLDFILNYSAKNREREDY